jgi:hypothetical protein
VAEFFRFLKKVALFSRPGVATKETPSNAIVRPTARGLFVVRCGDIGRTRLARPRRPHCQPVR